MAGSAHNLNLVDREIELLAENIRQAIGRRTGEVIDVGTATDRELTALGIDSLLLLRIIADVVVDPTLEIDVVELSDLVTVADLQHYLINLASGS